MGNIVPLGAVPKIVTIKTPFDIGANRTGLGATYDVPPVSLRVGKLENEVIMAAAALCGVSKSMFMRIAASLTAIEVVNNTQGYDDERIRQCAAECYRALL